MSDLIEERTGAKPGESAPYFKMNPKVDDIPEKYALKNNGIKLMRMGRLKRGGSGCYCPENALLRALLTHLLLARNEVVILDMEAGIEHLGRGTARVVDKLVIVVEPGRRSVETAYRITELAKDIGLQNIAVVGNKVKSQAEKDFIISSLPGLKLLGFIPYDQAVVDADLAERSVTEASKQVRAEVKNIYQALLSVDETSGSDKSEKTKIKK